MRMRFLFVFITLIGLYPIGLYGQRKVPVAGELRDQPDSTRTTVVDLAAVEVRGKTESRRLREGSFTVNSLDVKYLASELNSLNSLIGRSGGIRIREEGGLGSDFDLSINGLSGNSVRYFIDNLPLTSVGDGVSLANIPVNIVDRIEIYKGVVPANLGSDALGGAINIVTKKDAGNYLDASFGAGSFNTVKSDLNAQYVNPGNGLFVRSSAGVNYSRNNYMMKGVEVWNPSSSEFGKVNVKRFHDDYFSFLGRLSVGVTDRRAADLLSVSASYSSVDSELQTGTVQSVVYGMAKRENESFNVSGKYLKRDFPVKGLSVDLSLSRTWNRTTVIDTAYRKYRWDGSYIESSRNEITGRGKSIRHTERPLTIGRVNLDYSLNGAHSFNVNYLLNHVTNGRHDDADADFEPSKDVFGKHVVGVSYSQSFWRDRLSNTFFVKEYISRLKVEQRDLSWTTGSDKIGGASSTRNTGYGFSSGFRPAEWLAVKTSFEHSVRLPLAREYLGNGTTVYPNFTLIPENSNNFNLGFWGAAELAPGHRLSYETGLFHRRVKDYIRFVITESEGMGQYANVNNVTVNGVESELRYDCLDLFRAIVNFSYIDEKNKTRLQANGKPEITYNDRMPNRPWLYGNVELNAGKKNLFGRKDNLLKLACHFQYVHWFYLTWKSYGSPGSKSTVPTQCLNGVSLTYSMKKERYNISLECSNIFDRTVYDNYMMQKPGRSFFCKFRLFLDSKSD